jgi:hypothetical protein
VQPSANGHVAAAGPGRLAPEPLPAAAEPVPVAAS